MIKIKTPKKNNSKKSIFKRKKKERNSNTSMTRCQTPTYNFVYSNPTENIEKFTFLIKKQKNIPQKLNINSKLSIIYTPKSPIALSPSKSSRLKTFHKNNRISETKKLYRPQRTPKTKEKLYKITQTENSPSNRSFMFSSYEVESSRTFREYFPDTPLFNKRNSSYKQKINNEYFTLEYSLEGHKNSVNCISKSSHFLVTGSADYTVKKWNFFNTTPQPYRNKEYLRGQVLEKYSELIQHKRPVLSVLSFDNLIVSSAADGSVKISGSSTQARFSTQDPVKCAWAFEKTLALGCSEKILIYDLSNLSKTQSFNSSYLASTYETQEKSQTTTIFGQNWSMFSGHLNGKVNLWDTRTSKRTAQILCHNDVVSGLNIVENNFFTCSEDGYLKHWDLRNFNNIFSVFSGGSLRKISLCTKHIITGGDAVRVWENQEFSVLMNSHCKDIISTENNIIAAISNSVVVWNVDRCSNFLPF